MVIPGQPYCAIPLRQVAERDIVAESYGRKFSVCHG